jgi:2-methylcitrate dehydratase PrpD
MIMETREITAEVSAFIEKCLIEQMPPNVIQTAKLLVTDLLGVATGGSKERSARIIQELIKEYGIEGDATVIGSATKSNPIWSSLANGISGHVLDFDDVSQPMYGHPTVAVLPAALAVGEAEDVDGRALLEAYIIGVEIAAKLSYGMNPPHYEHGWHSTCTLGSLGAAAASAKILGLKGEQLRSCLAIAASQASGLQQNFGTMTKPFHAGKAAENGVLAATLAKKGWTGDQNILEAPLGFFHLFCGPENYDAEKVVDQLGKSFEMEQPGIILKKYPSCAFSHPAIDAALAITQNPDYRPDEIELIEGQIHELADQILIHRHPQTGLEAKFSAEACVALALLDQKVDMNSFADDKIKSNEFREMMGRVKRQIASENQEGPEEFGPARVRVVLKNGKALEASVKKAKGNPENPMSPEEIQEKYRACCVDVLPETGIEKSISLLQSLEDLEKLSKLMECYRVTK